MTTSNETTLLDQLKQAIDSGDRSRIQRFFSASQPVEAANMVIQLDQKQQKILFELLHAAQAADVVEAMEGPDQVAMVEKMSQDQASDVIEQMESDEGADLLRDLPPAKAERIIRLMEPEEAREARELMSYPKDSAGDLMAKEFIAFEKSSQVSEVLRYLRDRAREFDQYSVSYIYVLDTSRQLVGVLRIRDLILKEQNSPIEEIMVRHPVSIPVTMMQGEVAKLFEQYRYLALPVTDGAHRMIGVVTSQDIAKSVEEDAHETFLKFSGIRGGEELRTMPFFARVRNRLSWLSVNVILNLVAASVIAFFQDTLKAVIVLAVFLPIISDMSGCSGNQAVAVSIRELTLERISLKQFRWILGKEVMVGFVNGLVLGLEIGLIAYFWKGIPMLGVVVALALWINTIVSVSIGGLIPVLLHRIHWDPALASAPVLTTLTDLLGFLFLLGLATIFLPYLV